MIFRGRPVRGLRVAVFVLLAVASGCTAGRAPTPPSAADVPELRAELREHPDDVDLMVRLAAAHREAGELDRARALLREALQRAPEHAAATFYLGLVHESSGNDGEATEAYHRFLELDGPDRMRSAVERRLALVRRRALIDSVRVMLEREAQLADREPEGGTVAVFPFHYRGAEPRFRPLGRAVAEFLVTDLSLTDRLTVVERSRVQLLLDEMELSESRYVEPATAVRSGRLLGAADLVQGLLTGGEREVGLEAAVVDARRPAPEDLQPVTSGRRPADEIFALENELALAVYDRLGVELTAAERTRVTGHPTTNLDAFLAFGRGLMAQDTANFAAAARHFREAARIDPGFSMASERAEAADRLTAAASTSLDRLARLAAAEGLLGREIGPVAGAGRAARDRTLLAPLPFERDAAAEVLGVEGVTSNAALLRILIPTPGGEP